MVVGVEEDLATRGESRFEVFMRENHVVFRGRGRKGPADLRRHVAAAVAAQRGVHLLPADLRLDRGRHCQEDGADGVRPLAPALEEGQPVRELAVRELEGAKVVVELGPVATSSEDPVPVARHFAPHGCLEPLERNAAVEFQKLRAPREGVVVPRFVAAAEVRPGDLARR